MGKLIVIEGLDGSGKSTQLDILCENLKKQNRDIRRVSFPDYDSNSSALVKMYLGGEFGSHPGDVNPYAASLFYAVDRYASYKTDWGKFYENGGVVISGRYTTSNAIHQTSKMGEDKWQGFLSWLYDLEYKKVAIPKPDLVIFLDMPISVSQKLLKNRYGGDENKKDIHESDVAYLEACRKAAKFVAHYSGFEVISCATEDGNPRTIEDISEEILKKVTGVL